MQHYGVNGYSLHAMNSLSAMYNLHQQAAQQAQHAPDYRPSVHALTLAERLAGNNQLLLVPFSLLLPILGKERGPVAGKCAALCLILTSIKLVLFLLSQRLRISRHYP